MCVCVRTRMMTIIYTLNFPGLCWSLTCIVFIIVYITLFPSKYVMAAHDDNNILTLYVCVMCTCGNVEGA